MFDEERFKLIATKPYLRPIEHSDLNTIQKWRNDPDTLPLVREYRLLSHQHIESWYEQMSQDHRFEMFMMQGIASPVGVCGLTYINWQNRHADLHFAIYKDCAWIDDVHAPYYYKLITEYAFDELNLNKIYVEMYNNDKKKISFFKEKGFHQDAILRQHYYHKGEYMDAYIVSLLKDEFRRKI